MNVLKRLWYAWQGVQVYDFAGDNNHDAELLRIISVGKEFHIQKRVERPGRLYFDSQGWPQERKPVKEWVTIGVFDDHSKAIIYVFEKATEQGTDVEINSEHNNNKSGVTPKQITAYKGANGELYDNPNQAGMSIRRGALKELVWPDRHLKLVPTHELDNWLCTNFSLLKQLYDLPKT